jgi:hypothetical protein
MKPKSPIGQNSSGKHLVSGRRDVSNPGVELVAEAWSRRNRPHNIQR